MTAVRSKKKPATTILEWAAIDDYWNSIQWDWESGPAPIYIGLHIDPDAADSNTEWRIWKFTWGSGKPATKRRKIGTWTGREALFA